MHKRHSLNPLVSIIVTVYNSGRYLTKCLDSLINQSYENIEILIIDDCSTDNSWKKISTFSDKRIRTYKNKENQGYLRSANTLLFEASGDLVTFQDSDDWSDLARIEKQVAAFTDDPDLYLCGTQCVYCRKGKANRQSSFPSTYQDVRNELNSCESSVFCGASVMFKQELIEKHGGFRDFFDRIGSEHLDWFWQRIISYKFINIKGSLYYYRAVDESYTRAPSLNPLQYLAPKIALLAYFQRLQTGHDSLDQEATIEKLKETLLTPYQRNPRRIYQAAVITQCAFGNYTQAIKLVKMLYKSGGCIGRFFAIYVILSGISSALANQLPRNLLRYYIKRNNRKFLQRHDIKV